MGPGSATDGNGRNQEGVPLATLTTGLKVGGTAKNSKAASSISSTFQALTIALPSAFASSRAVGLKLKTTDVIVAEMGGAGEADISAANSWSEMIYISPANDKDTTGGGSGQYVTDFVRVKSAAGTVLEYMIFIF